MCVNLGALKRKKYYNRVQRILTQLLTSVKQDPGKTSEAAMAVVSAASDDVLLCDAPNTLKDFLGYDSTDCNVLYRTRCLACPTAR